LAPSRSPASGTLWESSEPPQLSALRLFSATRSPPDEILRRGIHLAGSPNTASGIVPSRRRRTAGCIRPPRRVEYRRHGAAAIVIGLPVVLVQWGFFTAPDPGCRGPGRFLHAAVGPGNCRYVPGIFPPTQGGGTT
jgi:hypothetical protein